MLNTTKRTTVRGRRGVHRTQMPWPYVLRHAASVASAATIAAVCLFSHPTRQGAFAGSDGADDATFDALDDVRRREGSP